MSRKVIEINVAEIAANAPLPQSFYDQFPDAVLAAIETAWPDASGYVCVLTSNNVPGCVTVAQTVDVGLLESQLQRSRERGRDLALAHATRVSDRVKACEEVRQQLRSNFKTHFEPVGIGH